VPAPFLDDLRAALALYGVADLARTPALERALSLVFASHQRADQQLPAIARILERRLAAASSLGARADAAFEALLARLGRAAEGRHPDLAELVRDVATACFDRPLFDKARAAVHAEADRRLALLARDPGSPDVAEHLRWLVECPQPLVDLFFSRLEGATPAARKLYLQTISARYYRLRHLGEFDLATLGDATVTSTRYEHEGLPVRLFAAYVPWATLPASLAALRGLFADVPRSQEIALDLYVWRPEGSADADATVAALARALDEAAFTRPVRRLCAMVSSPGQRRTQTFTFRTGDRGLAEDRVVRGLHPMMAKRLRLSELSRFDVERLPSAEEVYLFRGVARENPKDERLFCFAEVRDLAAVRNDAGQVVSIPHLERTLAECLSAIRSVQARRPAAKRLHANRVKLYVWPPLDPSPEDMTALANKLSPATHGLGLEKVVVHGRILDPATSELRDMELHVSKQAGMGLEIALRPQESAPIEPLGEYEQKVVRMRQRGLPYPYEVVRMLAPPREGAVAEFPPGEFVEHDLDGDRLVPVTRAPGKNTANVVCGVLTNFTDRYPEGMKRVVLLGDPSKSLGSLAEPECRRIHAALDLAEQMKVPVEWFALSSGARISMTSGTENMDHIADVIRRIVLFTQAGGELNVVVMGINVGAQPYWNAEATMLMHTKGILVMMPPSSMVLTGKRALDYSGGVSAEDDLGIGGYERIMGPNGQAQYFARDVADACHLLLRHYEHSYVAPGERFPRPAPTTDPRDRDVLTAPHGGEFATIGEIFSDETNPGRKKPFDIRKVMAAAIDQDHAPLERWADMRDAEIAVVWDAHLGGHPVEVIGIESQPLKRRGVAPADGPEQWTGGTLFPKASKKVARAINAASGSRPVVLLANLSGFDGSPESLRECQLEFGAEIGRAVVNFQGPIVFCVVSRFHGGAYVVFSRTLADNLEVVALEGTFASVIGGAPAAGVVFAGEVAERAKADGRVVALETRLAAAAEPDRRKLRAELDALVKVVRAEKVGELAFEFDHEHSVHRALRVGSLHRILPPRDLRPYLVDAVERGMAKELARVGAPA
jgi:acetyl-CoA carboxylase carboxyltransferase component